MDNISPKPDLENAAWVRIVTKLDAQTLYALCMKVERLFRLNPYLHFKSWEHKSDHEIQARWENHSNDIVHQIDTRMLLEEKQNEICVKYQSGIKCETFFMIKSDQGNTELVIVDNYGLNGLDRVGEVDKSIQAWGGALKRFFNHYTYLRHVPYSLNLIDRYWIRLSPIARRITYILLVITAVEIIALLVFVIVMLASRIFSQ